jgi:hypothetical protein
MTYYSFSFYYCMCVHGGGGGGLINEGGGVWGV